MKIRYDAVIVGCLLAIATGSCGNPKEPRNAQILPVQGLEHSQLGLAPASSRCEVLKSFVVAFALQYAPGRYLVESCSSESGDSEQKLLLSVLGREGAELRLVVRNAPSGASFLSCRATTISHQPPATRCLELIPGPQIVGITDDFIGDDVRLQDMVLTLAGYMASPER